MVILIDEASDLLAPPPKGFPTCSSFEWNEEDFSNYVHQDSHIHTPLADGEKDNKWDTDNVETNTTQRDSFTILTSLVGVLIVLIVATIGVMLFYKDNSNKKGHVSLPIVTENGSSSVKVPSNKDQTTDMLESNILLLT